LGGPPERARFAVAVAVVAVVAVRREAVCILAYTFFDVRTSKNV
jgi:hypothetical protein